jgi:1-acyl-sn-glycerol-3-phosphate acyltransferase
MMQRKFSDNNPGAWIAACARLLGFFGLIVTLAPAHLIYIAFKPSDPFRIPRLFHRLMIRLLGFHIRVHGTLASTSPVLFVANHSSYLDIPVLGTLIPASFVAKAEVARWPVFGFLARLQQTIFVERKASRTRDHKDGMRARFEKKQNLILFPEGTSSDGLYVLPFKSGLFGVIEEEFPTAPVMVQPVSIACTELDGLPITRARRPYYAWFGDMTLVGHLWNVFKIGRFTVDVVFHPPVSPRAFADRKALASYCQKQVAQGVEQCLAGRTIDDSPPTQIPNTESPIPIPTGSA